MSSLTEREELTRRRELLN